MFTYLRQLPNKILLRNPTKSNYKFIIKELLSIKDINVLSRVLESKRFSQAMKQIEMRCPMAKRALVISPHPDDDIFSSGGTIMHLLEAGCDIKVIYLTIGTNQRHIGKNNASSASLVLTIENEAKEAARQLGINVEFWRFCNRMIPVDANTIEKFRNTVYKFNPEVIFLPFIADDHDDHRRSVHLFYDSFKNNGLLDFEIWAYQVYSTVPVNVVVDITDVFGKKMGLIDIYQSRKRSRDWAHYVMGMNAMNSRFLKTNKARYAETFFVVPAIEYIEICSKYFENSFKKIYSSESYARSGGC